MAEYIEREVALALIRPDDPNDEQCAVTVATAKRLIKHALTAAPAADVALIVRCKGCKYSCKDRNGRTCEGYWYELSEFAVPVKDDGFCSYGKPKEG